MKEQVRWLDLDLGGWKYWYTKEQCVVYKRDRKVSSFRLDTVFHNTTMETLVD